MIGTKCIIRCYASGVHFGTLVAHEGRQVTLSNARRLWSWNTGSKANGVSLSGVAVNGVVKEKTVIDPQVDRIMLLDALEIIPASAKAIESIEAAHV
jgi:hypothetical protein